MTRALALFQTKRQVLSLKEIEMADDDATRRLAGMKRDQRARAGKDDALRQLLSSGGQTSDDKLATVKVVQKVDQRRVLSAVRHLLDKDGTA